MWVDPIVAEVHRAREKLAAQYNFDVGAFFADFRNRQAALGERLILPTKRQKERLKLTGATMRVPRRPRRPIQPQHLSLGLEPNRFAVEPLGPLLCHW